MSLPAAWTNLPNFAVPATGSQPTGSTMLLQQVYAGNDATRVPTVLNAKSIGTFQALVQVVYTYVEDGRSHPPFLVYQAAPLTLNSNRLDNLFRFNVQSLARNGDWGSSHGPSKQGYLQQWYGAGTQPAHTPLSLAMVKTPDWVHLNRSHLYQGDWAVFIWIQKAPCIRWSVPSAGRQAYVVIANTLALELGSSCAAPPPPPPPPSPAHYIQLAEVAGGAAAVALVVTFLLPGRYGRLVGPLRFIGVLLAATAAALGLASTLPSKATGGK